MENEKLGADKMVKELEFLNQRLSDEHAGLTETNQIYVNLLQLQKKSDEKEDFAQIVINKAILAASVMA